MVNLREPRRGRIDCQSFVSLARTSPLTCGQLHSQRCLADAAWTRTRQKQCLETTRTDAQGSIMELLNSHRSRFV